MLKHLNIVPKQPSRVVILGASGFVGTAIKENLLRKNIPCVGLTRAELDLQGSNAEEKLSALLEPADHLIMTSAIAPCKTIQQLISNLQMIEPVSSILQKVKLSQFIYVSSDAVYSDELSMVNENSVTQPNSIHGVMHSSRECILKSSIKNIPLTIVRPSLLYGEKDPHNGYGPNKFRRLAKDNQDIILFGKGEEKRDHVYIKDLAEIISLIILYKSYGVLNIATGASMSFIDVAKMINSIYGPIEINTTERSQNAKIKHRYFDITAMYAAFPAFKYSELLHGLTEVELVS